jgi:protein-disulfide isomerase
MMVRKILLSLGGLVLLAGPAAADAQVSPRQAPAAQAFHADGGSAVAGALGQQVAEAGALYDDDRVLGDADAPITIIEYASLTCPHCASFHNDVLPQLKSEWLDTGRARLVFRDFPLDRIALNAALLARCMPEDRYFGFLAVLFRSQDTWARSADPIAALSQLARTAGMIPESIDACFANEELLNTVVARVKDAQEQYDTPSFVVNGEVMAGARGYEDFDTHLKKLESDS